MASEKVAMFDANCWLTDGSYICDCGGTYICDGEAGGIVLPLPLVCINRFYKIKLYTIFNHDELYTVRIYYTKHKKNLQPEASGAGPASRNEVHFESHFQIQIRFQIGMELDTADY